MKSLSASAHVHVNEFLPRAAFASFVARSGVAYVRAADEVAERLWPADRVTPRIITRATVAGASTGEDAWAGALAAEATGAFFGSLAPLSAGARLVAAGARVTLNGTASITFPGRSSTPAALPWVGEGEPIPVRRIDLTGATLGPAKKMATIAVHSRELARSSAAEAVFVQLLREDAAATLDAAMFNDAAATDDNPAGLLNGVTPITATAGGGATAMKADLAALAASVAAAGGSGSVAYIAHPTQAAAIEIELPDLRAPVWASRALAAGTVVALDPSGFASAFGAAPDIEASTSGVLHMDDTSPEQISTAGTPNEVAAPTQSMFQTGQVAVRVIVDAAFTMRASGLVAVVEGVTW